MQTRQVSVEIAATSDAIFDVMHDYSRRLDWDPFLREARLLGGVTAARVGVTSRCAARWRAGGAAMDTVYVAFKRPHVAAVKMTRGPWFLRTFAASIRHEPIAPGVTRVVYRYWLAVRPAFLKYIFEPLLDRVLLYETRRRLRALKRAMENGLPQIHSPRTIAAAECDVV